MESRKLIMTITALNEEGEKRLDKEVAGLKKIFTKGDFFDFKLEEYAEDTMTANIKFVKHDKPLG